MICLKLYADDIFISARVLLESLIVELLTTPVHSCILVDLAGLRAIVGAAFSTPGNVMEKMTVAMAQMRNTVVSFDKKDRYFKFISFFCM